MQRQKILLIIFFLISFSLFSENLSYNVKIFGIGNNKIIDQIKNISDLYLLKDKPPRSINALKYRAQSDLSEILKLLYAYGYYDSSIKTDFENQYNRVLVSLHVTLGTRYVLNSYKILGTPCTLNDKLKNCDELTLENLGIDIGKGLFAEDIIQSEKKLKTLMGDCGYPLSKIEKKNIVADCLKKEVTVDFCIDKGPICFFGPTTIDGIKHIKPKYIMKQIDWCESEKYSKEKILETQENLLKTDLFSSVVITHADELDSTGSLPMKIHIAESKHKSLSAGISYETIFGPGISFSLTNRNMRGLGEKLSLSGNITKKTVEGVITYLRPDFIKKGQDYLLQFIADREKLHLYLSHVYSVISRVDSKINEHVNFSWGIKGEYINVEESISNGTYFLTSLPIYTKVSFADSILNPTDGYQLVYRLEPYLNILNSKKVFLKQTLLQDFYYPVAKNKKFVMAFRLEMGSILGLSPHSIPMTKLFLGGSDDNIRGYRYRSLGPKDSQGEIIGGKGVLYFTIEPRIRLTEKIGIVPFFDMGNFNDKPYPKLKGKWYKALGGGIRYFTFMGPLRFDVGFPLDRDHKDPRYRIYVSIGQAF